jgi:hypothetical protein
VRVLFQAAVFMLVLVACSPKTDLLFSEEMLREIPDSIIAFEQMTDIMVDVHLAESLVQESQEDSVRLNRDEILAGYYGEIMRIHHVDQALFLRSYDYYVAHPLVMNRMYQIMTERLSLLESRYKKR